MSRAEAAWLIWESELSSAASHRISQLLYGLRKRAGAPCAHEISGVIRGILPCDLSALSASAPECNLEELADLIQREFLSEVRPPTASFSHWVDGRRASVRRRLREQAAGTIVKAEGSGEWGRVSTAAAILVGADPEDERALRILLKACALRRSRIELDVALRSYGERYLAHTGERWQPERETLELLRRIERVEIHEPPPSSAPVHPLVGRGVDVGALHEALRAPPGAVKVTVVRGESGIGKTRLVSEVLARLRLSGFRVLESRSSPLQRELPLYSLLGAISDASVMDLLGEMDEPWRSSLTPLLPGVPVHSGSASPSLDVEATSRRLLEAVYQLFLKLCAAGPTVLFLDDLQWLDKTTLCALEFLRERTPQPTLSVVLALRDDVTPDRYVDAFLESLGPDTVWIRLEELDRASAGDLIDHCAPRALTVSERDRLAVAAGRNPFFLIELVNDYCAQSSRSDGAEPAEHVPSSVRQLISNRLNGLSSEARTVMQLLSLVRELAVDEPFPIQDPDPARLADIADDLLRARLIEHRGGVVRVRHELIRQAVYDLMGPVKRAALHRRVAEFVIRTMGEAGHGEAAIHFDRAGERAATFTHATLAASAAQASGAVPEAIRFLEIARRSAEGEARADEVTGRLASLLYDARRLEEAVPMLEAAAVSCSGEQRVRYALMRIDALSELPGARQEAHLEEVDAIVRVAAATKKWTEYAESVEVRLRILDRLHREDEIRAQLLEVRAILADGRAPTAEAVCILNSILAISDLYFDEAEALSLASVAVQLAEAHNVDRWLLRAHTRRLLCYVLRGQLHTDAGRRAVQDALSAAERGGDMKSKVGIYNNAGCYYVEIGDLDSGAQFLRHAETLACGPSERVLVFANLGELHLQWSDLPEAARWFEMGLGLARSRPVFGFAEAFLLAGLGVCSLEQGRMAAANQYEGPVRSALTEWIHDPYLLIRFLAELERRRGRLHAALDLVSGRANKDRRRPVHWLRSRLLEAKYLRLIDPLAAASLLSEVEDEAARLGLGGILTLRH